MANKMFVCAKMSISFLIFQKPFGGYFQILWIVKRKPIKQRKKLRKRNKLIAIESYSLNQDFNPSLEEGRNLLPSFHEKYTARTIVDHQ